MKLNSHGLSARLRVLADWFDEHPIAGRDLCIARVDGWGDLQAHVAPEDFESMTGVSPDDLGHGKCVIDGVEVVTFETADERKRRAMSKAELESNVGRALGMEVER